MHRLERMGVDRNKVETVIVTHAHDDHILALLDINDRPTFPNAKV